MKRAGARRGRRILDRSRMEQGIRIFLEGLGPVLPPGSLRQTPALVARAFSDELLAGYREGEKPLLKPLREAAPDALVVVRGIRFASICRHHLLPFHGVASVAYWPSGRLAGFSSLARLVETMARRLQIQEALSEEILDRLEASLSPKGSACLIEATHECMTCRGARQPGSRVITFRVRGILGRGTARREVASMLQAPADVGAMG